MQPMIRIYNAEPVSARIGVAEAAALMGVTPMYLRVAIQAKIYDFGECLRLPGSSKYTYYINRARFMLYLEGRVANGRRALPANVVDERTALPDGNKL